MLPFKNVLEMGRAHVAACFYFLLEHTLSYLLENFGRAVGKLAVSDPTAVKKTKILLFVNNDIHHVLILPLLGHFKDKSLAFAFDA
ncbi:hypothetical protein DSO57_1016406 [Entomophthora muscae]|uniref:Uncharacterized protein n=1 Tax=Entomophthora muscae TaxID=34485 RepID=A0ACC2RW35_9FUNG|nr:hypothetical protein DSO57_1016406 [Entomophthora muscae]